ncbi:MAG: transposase [Acidimicrobiia bacterium]
MNRGNRKAPIFEDEHDCDVFSRILIDVAQTQMVKILAGSLMWNHFHLAVTTPLGNLSVFMQELEERFARYSNWRHKRVGHLFQGRFRDVVIEHDMHLLIALCYIFMNPVAAGLCSRPEDYKWSTYAASVGLGPVPRYLSLEWLQALFPGLTRAESARRLRDLVGTPRPAIAYLHNLDVGVDANSLNSVVRSYIGSNLASNSLPREYRVALRPPLGELLPTTSTGNLAEAITKAHIEHGYKLAEIAVALGMSRSNASKSFRKNRIRSVT